MKSASLWADCLCRRYHFIADLLRDLGSEFRHSYPLKLDGCRPIFSPRFSYCTEKKSVLFPPCCLPGLQDYFYINEQPAASLLKAISKAQRQASFHALPAERAVNPLYCNHISLCGLVPLLKCAFYGFADIFLPRLAPPHTLTGKSLRRLQKT